ncbi:MAG: hypothetical protein C0417_03200 [Chlorobiaceae bacterium]|nr:hypothetical protein [Chlorobiaceae bacterium]
MINLITLMNRKKSIIKEKLPAYCDYSCKYAAFAPEDSTGACRREQAVYCKLVGKFNNKNANCLVKKK